MEEFQTQLSIFNHDLAGKPSTIVKDLKNATGFSDTVRIFPIIDQETFLPTQEDFKPLIAQNIDLQPEQGSLSSLLKDSESDPRGEVIGFNFSFVNKSTSRKYSVRIKMFNNGEMELEVRDTKFTGFLQGTQFQPTQEDRIIFPFLLRHFSNKCADNETCQKMLATAVRILPDNEYRD